jgi:glycosyltransferase involved in cell wall biosynthesis
MIVRDEEDVLERCLSSIHDLVDEIIIVDTGSIDKTKEIAAKFTDKIFDFEWNDHFSEARNFSFSHATQEYILFLDADDILYEKDREKFKALKETLDPSTDSVMMKYNIAFDQSGNPTFSYLRNRLVKRERQFQWEGACHGILLVDGNIINSDICITHKKSKSATDRNLKIYQKRLKNGDIFNSRDIFYYANELYDNRLYEESLIYYNKLLDMDDAWFENKIYSCGRVFDYYSYIQDYDKAFLYGFKSFQYDLPRPDFCCRIGRLFKLKEQFNHAIYWFTVATTLEKPTNSMGFIRDAYFTYIPHLELCVCYENLGNHQLAFNHNELARNYAPENETALKNVEYFKKLGLEKQLPV